MTPEQRKDALVGLLGRVRTNAGSRLPARSGDEEEFVPKSVLAARAAATDAAVAPPAAPTPATRPRFAPDGVHLDTDPPPTAIPGSTPDTLEEALRQAEQAELDRAEAAAALDPRISPVPPTPRAPAGEDAPAIEVDEAAELELDLYDPFDETAELGAADEIEALVLESDPPPRLPPRPPAPPLPRVAAPPPSPASATRGVAPMGSRSPTIESPVALPPPAPAPVAAPPPGARLVPRPSPSSPGGGRPSPASTHDATPSEKDARPVPAPAPISRVEPASRQPLSIELPFDEETEERAELAEGLPDDDVDIVDPPEAALALPRRAVDPLAQTTQNPIPAAFERAVLRAEGAVVPTTDAPPAPEEGGAERAPPADDEPVSSKQSRARGRVEPELDDSLAEGDVDEPPQSGEVASQRQPATGQHDDDLDLDGATPTTDHADAVASEAMAMLDAEAVPSAPPATRPAVMGRRPVAVTSFLDVLDDALSLGE